MENWRVTGGTRAVLSQYSQYSAGDDQGDTELEICHVKIIGYDCLSSNTFAMLRLYVDWHSRIFDTVCIRIISVLSMNGDRGDTSAKPSQARAGAAGCWWWRDSRASHSNITNHLQSRLAGATIHLSLAHLHYHRDCYFFSGDCYSNNGYICSWFWEL